MLLNQRNSSAPTEQEGIKQQLSKKKKEEKEEERRREERMKKRGNEFYSFEFAVVYSCKRERERERVGGSEVLYCTH